MGREKIRKPNDVHEIPTVTKWSTRTKAIVGGSIATAVAAVIIVAVVPPAVLLSRTQVPIPVGVPQCAALLSNIVLVTPGSCFNTRFHV
ncbi:unnamed protein product, partial [Rotaria magnacalcarata]